jgi:hypothetical protein
VAQRHASKIWSLIDSTGPLLDCTLRVALENVRHARKSRVVLPASSVPNRIEGANNSRRPSLKDLLRDAISISFSRMRGDFLRPVAVDLTETDPVRRSVFRFI